ncbi:hypothetical protein ALC57_03284 [Trachymyrmex cornetzi]|uniref:Uncharacterized protein n=1 Tax=Trachymyrmex cornetzi TaxID=471704 RepID=A0A195EFB9_9HYME|nr:hypothetical protein ALC57_03284 [Trachymyrmex cornetzi]
MRLMKYSSPSCHSSRSLAPYIIQEGEGGCIERKGRERGPGEKIEGRERAGSFHRGNCTSFDHGDNCLGIRSIDHAWNLSRIADMMDRTDGSEGKLADEAKSDIFCDALHVNTDQSARRLISEMILNQFVRGWRTGDAGAGGRSVQQAGAGEGRRNAHGQMRDISSRLIINSIECPLIDIMLLQRDQSWLDDRGNAIGPARIVKFEISRQEPTPLPLCLLPRKRWFRLYKCIFLSNVTREGNHFYVSYEFPVKSIA